MYHITMETRSGKCIDMPDDKALRLFEACHRADIYKENNADAVFTVICNDTEEIMYQV